MNIEEETIASEEIKLSDNEIFTKIWFKPRMVFKYINDNQYDKYVYVLLILAGIMKSFDRAADKNMGDNLSLIFVISICILLGGLLGWISYYIYTALLSWTGKWLDGKGDTKSLLRMTSYAMIPAIFALVFIVLQVGLFGIELFQSGFDVSSYGFVSIVIYFITLIFEIILGLWSLVIFVIGLSEIQKLSIGKSILNMLLPVFIIIIPIALIAFVLGDLFK